MKKRTVLCGLLAALLLAGCAPKTPAASSAAAADNTTASAPAASDANTTAVGDVFGSFSTTALDGAAADQSVFANADLTLVNLWGTFCDPCIREMPVLNTLAGKYADQGFQIVGIPTDVANKSGQLDDKLLKTAQDIVATTGVTYLNLIPNQELKSVVSNYPFAPTSIFVDRDGNQVGDVVIGAMEEDAWAKTIEAKLAEVKK